MPERERGRNIWKRRAGSERETGDFKHEYAAFLGGLRRKWSRARRMMIAKNRAKKVIVKR